MPREGAIIFGDLAGKLDVLRIECLKRGRSEPVALRAMSLSSYGGSSR